MSKNYWLHLKQMPIIKFGYILNILGLVVSLKKKHKIPYLDVRWPDSIKLIFKVDYKINKA